jgi:hypothetical protein
MTIDIDALRAKVRTRRTTATHDSKDRNEADADLEMLIAELELARAEVKRQTEEDDDLRGSAAIWIRLYDASLRRAREAEVEVSRLRQDQPGHVQQLYAALDRVADLTDAIHNVVRACEACARVTEERAAVPEHLRAACARCQRALDALQTSSGVARSDR